MREIKFRAWHVINKKMVTVYQLDMSHNASDGRYCDGSEGYFGENMRMVFSLSDVELVQFTGLLDKNGKEIYEGDIVKIIENSDNGIAQVIWRWTGFYIFGKGIQGQMPADARNYFEVIGNIYEHSNLLN